MVKYKDQSLVVRTELARSTCKDRGLNILQYEKQSRLINIFKILYATTNFAKHLPKFTESVFQEYELKTFLLFSDNFSLFRNFYASFRKLLFSVNFRFSPSA